jgi:hypothetical protein
MDPIDFRIKKLASYKLGLVGVKEVRWVPRGKYRSR